MKLPIAILFIVTIMFGCQPATESTSEEPSLKTFCNPIDISYRFQLDEPSRREAADPTVIRYKEYFLLFASKSGGYWYSKDLAAWTFIETSEIPTEEYAPTTIVVGDTVYFLASSNEKSTIYASADPLSGKWTVAVEQLEQPVWDPAFFLDDDNRMYLYWGCSNQNPLYGVEVDYQNNFAFLGKPKELIHADPTHYGWEVPGDYNREFRNPWIEGAWMNKINGKYYLQYAGPGTEFKSYSDAVYTSDSPLGDYIVQPQNPFAYKPEGFAAGAGHGSTFTDDYGNLWHIGTITISQKHMFERRLGIYPTFTDKNGVLYTATQYGDYPMALPNKKTDRPEDFFPGWMLLSYKKKVDVSSAIDSLPASHMVDEDIRTYWAAEGGGPDEFAILDLGDKLDVYAIQINFAEHQAGILGIAKGKKHRYTLEYSDDATQWNSLIDQSTNSTDNSHPYVQLDRKISCRYLKLTNVEIPGGHLAISGLRVFGKGNASAPGEVARLDATRQADDRRSVQLQWDASPGAIGYTIRYGTGKESMYHSYQVYDETSLSINSLNSNLPYYFTIESFNESGITRSDELVLAE